MPSLASIEAMLIGDNSGNAKAIIMVYTNTESFSDVMIQLYTVFVFIATQKNVRLS